MEFIEYGYSRDNDEFRRGNISLIASKENIPINYTIYPGSVVDMTTLENAMKRYEAMGIKNIRLILDRGFFNKRKLFMFLKSDYNFIIGAVYIFKEIKCIALMSKRDIENTEHLLRIRDNIIFYREAKMVLDGEDLSFYL